VPPVKSNAPDSSKLTFSEKQIQAKVLEIWSNRGFAGNSPAADRQQAIELLKGEGASRNKDLNRIRKGLSWANQRLIWLEKKAIEPIANLLDRSDIFRIVEKVSPILEAIGVIAIPFAILFFTLTDSQQKESRERQKRAQEAVKTYLNQLTTVYLDGDLKGDTQKSKELRRITRASTLALLNDPDLDKDGARKGQIIDYLTDLELVQGRIIQGDKNRKQTSKLLRPLISLSRANLRGANLFDANLIGADLTEANLIGANLFDADLIGADLSRAEVTDAKFSLANLTGAKFRFANLRDTDLSDADLSSADLSNANLFNTNFHSADLPFIKLYGADLSNANLRSANLRGADLRSANLRGAVLSSANFSYANLAGVENLTDTQLKATQLCQTKLPESSKLNSNRDCKDFDFDL